MEGNRQLYLSRAGGKITLEELTALMDAETLLTAQECLDYGFCDEIAEQQADPAITEQIMQRMNGNLAAQMKYFGSLKQSFGEAMSAFKNVQKQNIPEPPEDPPAEPPEDIPEEPPAEPEENTIQKLIAALFR
jgi:uncharacterized coiled-coil protein SlyX